MLPLFSQKKIRNGDFTQSESGLRESTPRVYVYEKRAAIKREGNRSDEAWRGKHQHGSPFRIRHEQCICSLQRYIDRSIHEGQSGTRATANDKGGLVGKRHGVGRLIGTSVGTVNDSELLLGNGKGDSRNRLLQGISLSADCSGDPKDEGVG